MKITLLGTGTPTPSLNRMSSGYMAAVYRGNLFFGEDLMVIPLSSPVPAKMR